MKLKRLRMIDMKLKRLRMIDMKLKRLGMIDMKQISASETEFTSSEDGESSLIIK
jgi:hypothetical protein